MGGFTVKMTHVALLAAVVTGAAGATLRGQADENAQVRDWRYLLTIHEIARADDDKRLQQLVGDNPDRTRTRSADGQTPVHVAAEYGALKSLRVLGKAGADFSVVDDKKRTPLTIAVGLNYAQTVKTLLELGADVNQAGTVAAGDTVRTPVSIAARQGHTEVVKILLDAKADVSKPDGDGNSPLVSAAVNRQWDTMKQLLEHAANPDVADSSGNTALIYAAQAGNVDAARAILKSKANPNTANPSKVTPIALATSGRDEKMAALLLEYKADANLADIDGVTPLLTASLQKNQSMVALLLSGGADPRKGDLKGRTPIGVSEDVAIWKLLAAKGADVNVMVGEATRLQHYIAAGDVERVKGWLTFKPDPLAPDRYGRTAKELARALAEKPTGTYEGDAARKEIAAIMEEYQKKAWEEREAIRKKK